MSEENTERFEGGTPFEVRVLRELANLNNRLSTLEEKVDARLKETRPIWEAVLSRLDSVGTQLNSMDARLEKVEDKFAAVAEELLDMRSDISRVKKRLPAA